MNIIRALLVLLIVGILTSCTESRWEADTSSIDYKGEILRLDQNLFVYENGISQDELLELKEKYGDFLNIYMTRIMQIGSIENPMTANLFSRFLADADWRELQDVINRKHPDLNKESAELENAFKRYAVLFKETGLPQITAYNSGFNVGIYPDSMNLGIGLEWYSGNDLDILNRLPPDLFPQYKRDKMMPEFMTINAFKGWLYYRYQNAENGDNLLNRMAFSGKLNYIAAAIMENVSDRVVLNYTAQQIEWCKRQEYDIWKFFLEKELIFSHEGMNVDKMMNDGPFTPGMPPESPGGVGNYIGYQMVKSYMDKNKNVTLVDLINMKNDRELLNSYKPGR